MSYADMGRVLRRRLIAGLIIVAPAGVTAAVLVYVFRWLDGILGRYLYVAFGRPIPGLGLLLLLVLLFVAGWLAERTIGTRVIGFWHASLERIPFARRVYNASNRIVRTMFSGSRSAFREVVLVEYPADGRWSIGFVAGEAPGTARRRLRDAVTVFVPTTPNPTSGWLVIVSRERTVPLAMTLEEAFTYILSAGVVTPAELEDAVAAAEADAAAVQGGEAVGDGSARA